MSSKSRILEFFILSSCTALAAVPVWGQARINGLPRGALVVETRKLTSAKTPNRMLALWLIRPKKNPTEISRDDVYSCPDQTRGSHYSGPTRVSLVDSQTMRIINTVKIAVESDLGKDTFDIPYAIRPGNYYRVEAHVAATVESKPTIIWLKDYNGDGRVLEFALFEAEACMGLQTTLIGYSEQKDRVIQFPIKLDVIEGRKHSSRISLWADYLFNEKPQRPGYWKYEIDYRGRAGTLDKYEVRYNAALERFEGTLTSIEGN